MDRIEIVRHEPELIPDWGRVLLGVEAQLPDGRMATGQVLVPSHILDDAERWPDRLEREWQAAERHLRDFVRDELQAMEPV